MFKRKAGAVLIALTLGCAITATPQRAGAEKGMEAVVVAIGVGALGGGLQLTSMISSAVYLGQKRHLTTPWQVFGYTIDSLTIGAGLVLLTLDSVDAPVGGIITSVGVVSLTLTILSSTLNKPKKPFMFAVSPILIRDVGGGYHPGARGEPTLVLTTIEVGITRGVWIVV